MQVGTDWASFRLTSAADRGRQLLVSYSIEDGLHASVDDRDGPDGEDRARTMHARGWQYRDRGWWQTEFTAPTGPRPPPWPISSSPNSGPAAPSTRSPSAPAT
ncbi:hypothetical protein ACFQ60_33195 [Streptomyces zhihengii]